MRQFCLSFLVLLLAQNAFAQGNEEFRAVWIVDSQWLSPDNSVEENQALTRQILDNVKKANMTSVLWQVRRFGTVYYPSSLEPWGPQVNFTDPGYDPLAFAVEEAHARGLEIHAWVNVFESRFAYAGSPAQQNPDWVCRDQDGLAMPNDIAWLSPGLADVRDYLKNVIMEIVNGYDIDGLHMDFIRWNEHTNTAQSLLLAKQNVQQMLPDGFITEAQLNELKTNASGRYLYDIEHPFSAGVPDGFTSWEDWWRWTVTEFVRTLHDSIQAVKPWVRLSPAALGRYNWGGWQGFNVVYQDAALWLNEGYIEQLIGMHYHWSLPEDFYRVLVSGCPNCWGQFIQPAIQAGRLYTVGLFSDSFSERKIFSRHKSIVDRVRDVPWVDGFQFFSYASWRDQNYWEAARQAFFNNKAKIRATGLQDATPPEAPSVALAKVDSLHYQVTVTPPASTAENLWFAVYRSPDDLPSVQQDEIVDIHFGQAQYSIVDSFSGTQDFNGRYSYFATALDRFWNESAVSGIVISDSIPSFAPTIVGTSPAPGDTVPVNQTVTIAFSKTMDVNTFTNAVAFSPAAAIADLAWSDDQKTVTVNTAGAFEFATDYTLTVDATVTDINGKALDGNGDGTAGDAFVLAFRTLARDIIGPRVIASFPDLQAPEDDFKLDEIITFQFDELVDKSSISDTSIILTQNGNPVPTAHAVTTVNNTSVLSIQPLQPLAPDQDYTVTLSRSISDTAGNAMDADVSVNFRTSPQSYSEVLIIEPFLSTVNWFQPQRSGSTMGIVAPNTSFEMSTEAFLPAVGVRQRVSPMLKYEWDPSASEFLLREYLSQGAPRDVLFDTSYVLQSYVFGDGSGNEFRFALDDNVPVSAAENHEVSNWVTVNWVGWRIVEWQLNDPNSVGIWIGDGVLDGTLRFDSFQLTHEPGDAISGKIFFDNLRLVKKSAGPVHVADGMGRPPEGFQLLQNYPNPFNPVTTIAFELPARANVELVVYDLLGREVQTLIKQPMAAGHHKVTFDAAGLASGVYVYRLTANQQTASRRMVLLK